MAESPTALRELYALLTFAHERVRASAEKLRARGNAIRGVAERLREAGLDFEAKRLRLEGAQIRDEAFELEQLQRRLGKRLVDNVVSFAATFDDTKPVRVDEPEE